MSSVELVNFRGSAECKYILYNCHDAFPQTSLKLCGGNIYGFISDFCYGGWGLSSCIAGRAEEGYGGEIYLDGKVTDMKALASISCFIPEGDFPEIDMPLDSLTIRTCLEYALNLGKVKESMEEIKRIFILSDGRFERNLSCVSGEIWLISMAVNYALGKEIFCFPWVGESQFYRIKGTLSIIKFLRDQGKMILIPTNQKGFMGRHAKAMFEYRKGKLKTTRRYGFLSI
jgi:hypothetical protein